MSTVILCVFCKFQLSFLNLRKNYWSCDGNAEFLLGCYQQLCSWIWQIVMSNERWQKILAVVMSQVAVSVSLPVPVEQKFFLSLSFVPLHKKLRTTYIVTNQSGLTKNKDLSATNIAAFINLPETECSWIWSVARSRPTDWKTSSLKLMFPDVFESEFCGKVEKLLSELNDNQFAFSVKNFCFVIV